MQEQDFWTTEQLNNFILDMHTNGKSNAEIANSLRKHGVHTARGKHRKIRAKDVDMRIFNMKNGGNHKPEKSHKYPVILHKKIGASKPEHVTATLAISIYEQIALKAISMNKPDLALKALEMAGK